MSKSSLWSLALLIAHLPAQTPPDVAAQLHRRVDALIQAWRQRERAEPQKLATDFVVLGADASPYLRELLDDKDDDLPRESMAIALGRLRDVDAVEPLARLLARRETGVRFAAVEALDRLTLPACLPVLAAAADDADVEVAGRACSALVEWTDKPHMVQAVTSRLPVAKAKGRLAQVLAGSGSDEGHAALLGLLEGDEELVLVALQGLRTMTAQQDAPRVADLLRHSTSIAVKREACYLLGKTRHQPAIGDLVELLSQDNAGLAGSAHWALKEITGQRLKPDAALWREWWSRSGKDR
jgi:HEAT repeat protein